MKRNEKKHLKELKRLKKRNQQKQQTRLQRNWMWPSIYCDKEDVFIGFSFNKIPVEKVRYKVDKKDWIEGRCSFRNEKYKIDFTNAKDDDIIKCPCCGEKVDFRLWISANKPEFYDIQDNPE